MAGTSRSARTVAAAPPSTPTSTTWEPRRCDSSPRTGAPAATPICRVTDAGRFSIASSAAATTISISSSSRPARDAAHTARRIRELFGAFAPDGRCVYLGGDRDRDLRAFGRVPLDGTGKPGVMQVMAERADAELGNFDIDDRGSKAVLVWNVAGRSEISFLDLATGKAASGPALPSEIAGGLEFSKNGREIVMTCSGSTRPADIWVLDVRQAVLPPVTHSPHAGVDLDTLVRPRLVQYPARDGLVTLGMALEPSIGKRPFPMVLSFHGGPEGQAGPASAARTKPSSLVASPCSRRTCAVRRASASGFVYSTMGFALRGISDIAASVDYVVKPGLPIPTRRDPGWVVWRLHGHGGTHGVSRAVFWPRQLVRRGELRDVLRPHGGLGCLPSRQSSTVTRRQQADLLRRLSPIPKVIGSWRRPSSCTGQRHHVPVVEAEQVVESLKKRGVPVEYVLFPDEGHGWRKTPNRIRSTIAITQWFEKYLGREAMGGAATR